MSDSRDEKSASPEDIIRKIITPGDVKHVAEKIFGESSINVIRFNLDSYSEDRLGILGYHILLKIVVQKSNRCNSSETIELFLKTLPFDYRQHVEHVIAEGFFREEIHFYQEILPRFLKNCKCERWSPTVYTIKENILIMENLKNQGFDVRSRFFDESTTLKSALSAVARFHSCSILTQAEVNRGSKHNITLDRFYPNSFKEKAFDGRGLISGWFSGTYKIIAAVAERLGFQSDELRRTFDYIYDIIKPSDKFVNVVCHGDLWTHNLMFDEKKPIPKCVLVDFQLIRYAPLVLDILQILYLNTTRSFREEFGQDLIRYYHSVLEETILSNDIARDVCVPFLKQILTEIEELKLFGPIVASFYFPAILMSLEGVVQDIQNLDRRIEFLNSDRVSLTLSQMEKDSFFKDRLQEVISEALELGERFGIKSDLQRKK